jgi:hypothetical protein
VPFNFEGIMQTMVYSKILKVGCLFSLAAALAQVSYGQLTWNLTSEQPTIWLEAGNNVTVPNGGSITTFSWADARANNTPPPSPLITVSNPKAGQQPTVAPFGDPAPGHNAISFSGNSYLFGAGTGIDAADLFGPTTSTIFIVEKSSDPTSSSPPAAYANLNWTALEGSPPALNNNHALTAFDYQGALSFDYGTAGAVTAPANTAAYYNSSHVLMFQRSGGGGQINVDGNPLNSSGSISGSLTGPGVLQIGGFNDNPGASPINSLNGSIAEIVVFKSALATDDITKVEGYLGGKYGISVVPEPSQYASVFGIVCVATGIALRLRRKLTGSAVQA